MKIILASDGSAASREAEWLLSRIPFFESTDLIIAHVMLVPSQAHLRHEFPTAVNEMLDQYQTQATTLLEAERERFEGINGTVETCLRSGHAADELVDLATDRRSDLIVVGARGLTRSQRFLVGSVSQRVARHAPCSVLVTRPLADAHSPEGPLRILICHDGSESSRQAVQTVGRFHWGPQVEITLLSVLTLDIYPAMTAFKKPLELRHQERRDAEAALHWAHDQLQATGATIHREINDAESIAEQIVETAHSSGAHLVVLGHRGLNRIERFFLGSISENVLRHAPCSVWIVREQPQD